MKLFLDLEQFAEKVEQSYMKSSERMDVTDARSDRLERTLMVMRDVFTKNPANNIDPGTFPHLYSMPHLQQGTVSIFLFENSRGVFFFKGAFAKAQFVAGLKEPHDKDFWIKQFEAAQQVAHEQFDLESETWQKMLNTIPEGPKKEVNYSFVFFKHLQQIFILSCCRGPRV